MARKIFNEIRRLPEFEKEFKKLSKKRFRTLPDDLTLFIETELNLFHKLMIDNGGVVPIPDLGIDYPTIYKAVKFACKSMKGKGVKSGIRIVYAYYKDKDIIEFIEIYYKGDKEREDKMRVKRHFRNETT